MPLTIRLIVFPDQPSLWRQISWTTFAPLHFLCCFHLVVFFFFFFLDLDFLRHLPNTFKFGLAVLTFHWLVYTRRLIEPFSESERERTKNRGCLFVQFGSCSFPALLPFFILSFAAFFCQTPTNFSSFWNLLQNLLFFKNKFSFLVSFPWFFSFLAASGLPHTFSKTFFAHRTSFSIETNSKIHTHSSLSLSLSLSLLRFSFSTSLYSLTILTPILVFISFQTLFSSFEEIYCLFTFGTLIRCLIRLRRHRHPISRGLQRSVLSAIVCRPEVKWQKKSSPRRIGNCEWKKVWRCKQVSDKAVDANSFYFRFSLY